MDSIIPIKGAVQYEITLDPSVWIFDDRKLTGEQLFCCTSSNADSEEYKKNTSLLWERELMEGSVVPPKKQAEKQYKKEELLQGTFFMPLAPFISHAEPFCDAKEMVLNTNHKIAVYPLSLLEEMFLLFCVQGKALQEHGPVHLYIRNMGNLQIPVKDIQSIFIQ
ncbi:MAG: peptidyl-prolyl cis-trans isomerase [Bacillus sp. (in: firmicutes)]